MKRYFIVFAIFALYLTTFTCAGATHAVSDKSSLESVHINNGNDTRSVHMEPPLTIIIRGESELAKLWIMLNASENELTSYLRQTNLFSNGLKNREDVRVFFDLISDLPLPIIPDSKFFGITYLPEVQSVTIAYKLITGEEYGFTYGYTKNTEDYIEEQTGLRPVIIDQMEGNRIKIYEFPLKLDPYAGFTRYVMDIDGYYANVTYRNESIKDFSEVTPDQVFGNAVLSTLKALTDYSSSEITVLLNGALIIFDQPPIMENNRVLVPYRAIYEALGAKVEWDNDIQTATATKGNKTIITQIDNKQISVDGVTITLDVPARLVNSRTLVPVRAVSEGLGAKVDWDNANKQVIITYKP